MQFEHNRTQYIVGKSAEDNWRIIQAADKDYYWIHANNIPSTHVIICIDVEPLKEEIDYACALCKKYTHAITASKSPIKYIGTLINNIKLGSKPGEVTFKTASACIIYTL